MKGKDTLLTIIGFCAFFALMCSGAVWLLNLCNISGGIISTLGNVARIVLIVTALIIGWLWLSSVKMNKTLKIVLQVFFIVFAVLAICGVFGFGL